VELSLGQTAGGTEGGQFAVAVPGDCGGGQTERLQQSQGAEADGADGRLGSLGGTEQSLLPLAGSG